MHLKMYVHVSYIFIYNCELPIHTSCWHISAYQWYVGFCVCFVFFFSCLIVINLTYVLFSLVFPFPVHRGRTFNLSYPQRNRPSRHSQRTSLSGPLRQQADLGQPSRRGLHPSTSPLGAGICSKRVWGVTRCCRSRHLPQWVSII